MDSKTEEKLKHSIIYAQKYASGYRTSIILAAIVLAVGVVLFAVLLNNLFFIPIYAAILIYFIIRWHKLENQYVSIIDEMERSLKRKIVKLSDTASSVMSGQYADFKVFIMGIVMMGASAGVSITLGVLLLDRAAKNDNTGAFIGGMIVASLGSVIAMPLINWIVLTFKTVSYNAVLRADGVEDERKVVVYQEDEKENRRPRPSDRADMTEAEQQSASIRRFGFGYSNQKKDK